MKKQKDLVYENKIVNVCDKVIEYGIYVLVFFVPLIFSYSSFSIYELTKLTFMQIITLILFFTLIIKITTEEKIVCNLNLLNFPIFIFAFILLISTIFSINPTISILGCYWRFQGLSTFLAYIILYVIIITNFKKRERIEKVILIAISSCFIVSTYGILRYFGIDFFEGMGDILKGRQAYSTFGNPNYLASYLCMIIPLTFSLFILNSSKYVKILFGTFLIVFYICLILTFSRSGWVSSLISSFFVLLLVGRKVIFQNKIYLLSLLIILFITTMVFSKCKSIIAGESISPGERAISIKNIRYPSIEQRLRIWDRTLYILRNHILIGTGLDTFEYVFHKYGNFEFQKFQYKISKGREIYIDRAHNEVLDISVSLGIFGLFVYLWVTIILFKKIIKEISKGKDNYKLSIGLISAVLSILIQNQFNFHTVTTAMLFWLFIGMNISLISHVGNFREKKLPIINKIKSPIYFSSVLIFLLISSLFIRYFIGDCYYYRGYLCGKKRLFDDASPFFKKAVKLSPMQEFYQVGLGKVYFVKAKQEQDLRRKKYLLDKSIEEYNKAKHLNPLNFFVYYELGRIHLHYAEKIEGTKLDNAIASFKHSLNLYPYNISCLFELGVGYLEGGMWDEAISIYREIITLFPNDAKYHINLAYAYSKKGLMRDVEKELLKAREIDPTNKKVEEELEKLKSLN